VTDPKKKKSPVEEIAAEREMQKAVEEGIDVVSEAMKQVVGRPKEERQQHLNALLARVRELSEKLTAANDHGEATERIKAVERVIEILQRIADRAD
jgi:hypothetical protein